MPEHFISPDPWLFSLFLLFSAATLVQMIFYCALFTRIFMYKNPPLTEKKRGISVVICAHNEYYNLQDNLPLILTQDYPEFEVIVVNHASDDDSSFLLTGLADSYPNLKFLDIREDLNFFSGKKFPLSIGIKSAKYEQVLLTDADCRPSSDQWITQMSSAFTQGKEIVLGYGAYDRAPGLLNLLIRFDTIHAAIQYLSYAMAGIPYMGVGRNLAYLKTLFYRNNGFIAHYRIKSGDDDLFINRVATKRNTAVMLHAGSFTYSRPKQTLGKWITQKKRHFSTGRYYRFSHRFLLGTYSISQFLFFALLITLLSLKFAWVFVLAILVLRIVCQTVVVNKWLRQTKEQDLVFLLPVYEFLTMLINGSVALSNLFMKPHKWK